MQPQNENNLKKDKTLVDQVFKKAAIFKSAISCYFIHDVEFLSLHKGDCTGHPQTELRKYFLTYQKAKLSCSGVDYPINFREIMNEWTFLLVIKYHNHLVMQRRIKAYGKVAPFVCLL